MDISVNDDDSSKEEEMSEVDRNIVGQFHRGFISDWDNNKDIEEERKHQESSQKEILWAAENGDYQRVSELLAKDRNLTKVTDKDGYTPLHRAAYNNHLEILEILLEYGADYNAETLDKWTPLHSACHWNSAKCVEKLLSLDLNVNAQSEGGITPLHLAASNSSSGETIQVLLLHPNIDTKIKNNSDETAYELAVRKGRQGRLFEVIESCFNNI